MDGLLKQALTRYMHIGNYFKNMKIEINSNIDWPAIAVIITILIIFVTLLSGLNHEKQIREQTIQKAIEKGWTIEQVQKL